MIANIARILSSATVLILGGCVIDDSGRTGPLTTDPISVNLDKSEIVRASLKIGAGKLDLQGGSPKLVDGTITYNVPDWKPVVSYEPSSFRGILTIEQPSKHGRLGRSRNDWDLRLNNDVPIDLSVECGAGQANLDVGALNLRGLSVEIGAGKIDLDLRGNPKSSYNARIEGGVGEATVHVPTEVGVSAQARGGLGHIEVEGLRKDGDHWVNDAWENSKVRVRLSVEGGIGHIHIISG